MKKAWAFIRKWKSCFIAGVTMVVLGVILILLAVFYGKAVHPLVICLLFSLLWLMVGLRLFAEFYRMDKATQYWDQKMEELECRETEQP